MTRALIIEDEIPARKKLKRFIEELDTPVEIVAEIDTIEDAVNFLQNNKVDVIFSDIELLDGNAFEIYSRVSISCPIIFTTAYNQFWMDAFDNNGIAYLLKPFSRERFLKAWKKFLLFHNIPKNENTQLVNLTKLIQQNFPVKSFKKRFTVHTPQGFYFLDTGSILFFEAHEGVIFAYDTKNKKHLLTESTLKEIEEQLNSLDFFRIHRGYLINKRYVEKVERYTKNILAIKMEGYDNYLKTSQNTTAAFREWIEK